MKFAFGNEAIVSGVPAVWGVLRELLLALTLFSRIEFFFQRE